MLNSFSMIKHSENPQCTKNVISSNMSSQLIESKVAFVFSFEILKYVAINKFAKSIMHQIE